MNRYEHWTYYQTLEDELIQVSKYVHITPDNIYTYSINLGKIIINSCIEIERQMRKICEFKGDNTKKCNILSWHDIIASCDPNFRLETVSCTIWPEEFHPWFSWSSKNSPDWWQGYNKIKHDRVRNLSYANLQNAINSVAALLPTTILFDRTFYYIERNNEQGKRIVIPSTLLPKLFSPAQKFQQLLGNPSLFVLDF